MKNLIKKNLFKLLLIVLFIPTILSAQEKRESKQKDTSIGYTVYGNGTDKIIVLHSWNGDAESWKPILPYANLEKYTYVFMDVRGYGKSKMIKGTYTSDEIANDVFKLVDNLGIEKFYLMGHSMTGIAVQKAALIDKDQRIKKVIAVAPVSSAGLPVDEKGINFFKSVVGNYEMTKVAFNAFSGDRLSDKWVSMRAKRNIEKTDQKAQMAYIKMVTEENFLKQMKEVKTPFLVITGKYDNPDFVASVQKRSFDTFQNVEFLDIETSGHFPMQETPIFFTTSIEKYLTK